MSDRPLATGHGSTFLARLELWRRQLTVPQFTIVTGLLVIASGTLLLAWAVFLASPGMLLGVPAFMLYIRRFQIVPEERALSALFGSEFADYCARVRRWL